MNYKSATDMARAYGMKSAVAFNKLLVRCGILSHTNNGYTLAHGLHGHGLVAVIFQQYFLPNGMRATRKKAVWTEAGQAYVHRRLGTLGITPVSETPDLFGQSN